MANYHQGWAHRKYPVFVLIATSLIGLTSCGTSGINNAASNGSQGSFQNQRPPEYQSNTQPQQVTRWTANDQIACESTLQNHTSQGIAQSYCQCAGSQVTQGASIDAASKTCVNMINSSLQAQAQAAQSSSPGIPSGNTSQHGGTSFDQESWNRYAESVLTGPNPYAEMLVAP
jgi:hypothetical protein